MLLHPCHLSFHTWTQRWWLQRINWSFHTFLLFVNIYPFPSRFILPQPYWWLQFTEASRPWYRFQDQLPLHSTYRMVAKVCCWCEKLIISQQSLSFRSGGGCSSQLASLARDIRAVTRLSFSHLSQPRITNHMLITLQIWWWWFDPLTVRLIVKRPFFDDIPYSSQQTTNKPSIWLCPLAQN